MGLKDLLHKAAGALKGGVKYPVDPGAVTTTTGGFRSKPAAQQAKDFFGPGEPLQPHGPEEAAGRAYDFAVGYNYWINPRPNEPITFQTLREIANHYDLIRLCIETRKDQLVKLTWTVRAQEGFEVKDDDKRIKDIRWFLRYPDRQNSWQAWLRLLIEDLLVIDAPCIYPHQNLNNELYALEVVDGSTITRKIDANGRTPVPPATAYQQIIKGMPATDYTTEQLIYIPRNPRPNKVYGFSPVEQIVVTANIALSKQLFLLNFYKEGNVPEGFAECPADWSAEQIKQWQASWDAVMAGNLEDRRRMQFIPAGTKPIFPKMEALKDDLDEWLARIICYCFSLPPTPFVKQMNRAVASTAQEAAIQEGLIPLMAWIKDTMDYIIWRFWGYEDLQFVWEEEEAVAPDIQATINKSNMSAGIVTRSEIRDSLGLEDDGVPDFIVAGNGTVILLEDIGKPPPEPVAPVVAPVVTPPSNEPTPAPKPQNEPSEKLEKAKKKVLNPSTGSARKY